MEQDKELAQAILAQAGDAIIFSDTEGTIRIWNAAAARIFGFAAEEALGKIEALQPIVGGGKSKPRLGIARMQFYGAPEMFFRQAKVVGAIVLLAKAQVVVRVTAEQPGF